MKAQNNFPTNKGESSMQKLRFSFSLYLLAILLFASVALANAAPQESNFVGTWNMTVNGGQGGGGRQTGDQGEAQDEGGGHRGGGAQTITITKDGDTFKVDHKTHRGDLVSNATVSGNTISWSEERKGRDGNSHTTQFKATLDGDSMSGTLAGGQFSRTFTAKRAG
jgi:hypothetical protein